MRGLLGVRQTPRSIFWPHATSSTSSPNDSRHQIFEMNEVRSSSLDFFQLPPLSASVLQVAQAPNGSKQASSAADTARLSLTAAAALAIQETSRIPGIDDSPQSASTDNATPAGFAGIFKAL